MAKNAAGLGRWSDAGAWIEAHGLQLSLRLAGRRLIRFGQTLHGLLAFSIIVLGVAVTKSKVARQVVRPLIRAQVYLAGWRSLPFIAFVAAALGFLVIGQTVSLLTRVGANDIAGTVMVTVIVRELGPLATALIVLARAGTIVVIELGTTRALGEVEALEAMAIDPVHYLVVPRVIGLALSVFSLTVYFILIALAGGYVFAFLQDVPLTPGEYVGQLARALTWEDFVLLALKTLAFGNIIGMATCYQGLARPLRLEDVAGVTTQAIVLAVVSCVILDLLFIVVYLLM